MATHPVAPIGQIDDMACWAASLVWFSAAMGGGRPRYSSPRSGQTAIIEEFHRLWESASDATSSTTSSGYGAIPETGLITLLRRRRWGLRVENVTGLTGDVLRTKMRLGPAILGYMDPTIGMGHVVVAFDVTSGGSVSSMDPWLPGTPSAGSFIHNGQFVERDIAFYNPKVRVIAWPRYR